MIKLDNRTVTTEHSVITRTVRMDGNGTQGLIMDPQQRIVPVRWLRGRGWFTQSYLRLEAAASAATS